MAYDESLAVRVRDALSGRDGLSERKMFGGLCFMLHGNMIAGVNDRGLMLRVGPTRHPELLGRPGARPMDFTGRPMNGFLYIEPSAFGSADQLAGWLSEATAYVDSLPPKSGSRAARSRRGAP
jgi:TfoX/Sxy family transcriptional regulator of competence genes